jgi:hypothetical protein
VIPPQTFSLRADALLDSIITPLAVQQALFLCNKYSLVPEQANVRALWDTGATGSCISQGLARKLGLKAIDMWRLRGIHGVQSSPVYQIDILLPSNVEIANARVCEFLDNGDFDVLIGMDIITLGDFVIMNNDKKTKVAFRIPSSDDPVKI